LAVTATVTATKIDITSTGGVEATWAECVTAINTHTAGTITMTGSPNEYTITAASYRELEISSGCIVRFEEGDTINWMWDATASTYVVLEFANGSVTTIEPNVTFDLGSNSQLYMRGYVYMHGSVTAEATLGNEIIFKHYRSCYMLPYQAQSFDYVNFEDLTYAGYALYFSNYSNLSWAQCDMDHITFSSTVGNVYFVNGGMIPTNLNLTNWFMDGGTNGLLIYSHAGVYFDTWTIKNTSAAPLAYGSGTIIGPLFYNSPGVRVKNDHQPYIYFKDCLFEDNDAGVYNYLTQYHSVTVFDNCEFKGTGTRIYATNYATMFLINPTYTGANANPVTFSSTGNVFIAEHLTLNVTAEGSAVEGAVISIIQSEGHIVINGTTDSNGKLLNPYGKETVLPISQQTATSVFDLWADSIAGGRYYTISIYKEGVGAYTEDFIFTGSKTINAVLYPVVETNNDYKSITTKIIGGIS